MSLKDDLSKLSHEAVVAFAGRCARRVLPILRQGWPDAPVGYLLVIEEAVRAAERWNNTPANRSAVEQRAAAASVVRRHLPARSAEISRLMATLEAAVNAAHAGGVRHPGAAVNFADRVVTAARAAVGPAREQALREATLQDLERLQQLEAARGPDATSLTSAVFGPLWPTPPPADWPDAAALPHVIDTCGPHLLVESLDGGTYGSVFRALDGRLPLGSPEVALKVSRLPLDRDTFLARYRREATLVSRLQHPHIVRLLSFGESGDKFYLAFELIAGQSLGRVLEKGRPDRRRAVRWIRELADALAHAHDNPNGAVVHRDIKPKNIMIDQNDLAILVDFGLGKQLGVDLSLTSSMAQLGSPYYMSPEAARRDTHLVDHLSDQYSLGVVLYELLTGQRPYTEVRGDLILQILGGNPPRPSSLVPDLPVELEAICLRAMHHQRENRYPHIRELSQALAGWLALL